MSLHIVRNLISSDLRIPSNVFYGWKDFLCSNSLVSVSLKYTFVSSTFCWANLQALKIVTSTKSIDVSLILQSIVKDSSWLLNRLMNYVSSSFQWVRKYIINDLNISSGLHLVLLKTASSKLAMQILANWVHVFAHGSARSLEKPLIIKHKIIM